MSKMLFEEWMHLDSEMDASCGMANLGRTLPGTIDHMPLAARARVEKPMNRCPLLTTKPS
jgi:hypothetical protein